MQTPALAKSFPPLHSACKNHTPKLLRLYELLKMTQGKSYGQIEEMHFILRTFLSAVTNGIKLDWIMVTSISISTLTEREQITDIYSGNCWEK